MAAHVARLDVARGDATALSHRLGRLAVASLHAELAAAPKPGLVTPWDSGSHDDMDAATFLRSLFALRSYFVSMAAEAGADPDIGFAPLQQLGIAAEQAMLAATGGINTHRGAIFSLGLLVAQSSRLHALRGRPASADAVCSAVSGWADALLQAPLDPASHGQRMRRAHGVAGVREQAAAGYPLLREVGVPALRDALADGLPRETAMVQALMQLVACVDDLNLLQRGGMDGLRFAQAEARAFLDGGGVFHPAWRQRMALLCRGFVARRLSPGGSADLLACSAFLLAQEGV